MRLTPTRSQRLVSALHDRGGRCPIDVLTDDLVRRGWPAREVLPALTIAVLARELRLVDADTVEVLR